MSFNQIYRVAGSAMTAQTIRLNTIASNLANAESPAASAATVYKARSPVFSAVYSARTAADPRGVQSAQVQVLDVVEVGGSVQRYEPNHPMANPQGYVFYPAVNVVSEMADMMSASRSFETNVEVLNSVKSMQQSVLKLGER
ncbi:flagellar basal body rod protein FlgC [Yersinia pestis]|uniref:Flagellar basal-body rod protein FlgC n=10 Tax=Yersinia pseudotuberculosis complex TaxID=1649845 RepID=A0AAX2I225_YERPE|nr:MULTISPECIES: flagellar basal body rod protein FlgC [Yersinia pseudotuberculosis complex]EDR31646.1 flagellar basal-body rod protein FlgC [Yersinia pestis biovar Orientalis str. IP275]EFA46956.1 flagellar basal-body rod protein FlgC [Yersinia pestis KIM D27]ERP77413.1 flagellar basal body rod protein FlgC [Yersinia pestis S3]ERP77528.1 flagellar basal body rod protein FlgC [Yersinia pestis 24H]CQD56371.1 flagellar basal-body rod protein [Yersinia intermedia]